MPLNNNPCDIKLIAKETAYGEYLFRSRVEARWAVFFDALGVAWWYELDHYDFGVKYVWDDHEFKEYLQEQLYENIGEDESEIISGAYRHRYEKRMYLPDFWLPEMQHFVEIKGKNPNHEEQLKAAHLTRRTNKPVTILWGHIYPNPNEKWGDCTEIYGGDMNIIALLALEYGVNSLDRAFTAARRAHFE